MKRFAVAALVCCLMLPVPARAFTPDQVASFIALLTAFNIPQASIIAIEAILSGSGVRFEGPNVVVRYYSSGGRSGGGGGGGGDAAPSPAAPTDISLSIASVAENSSAGATVGILSASSQNAVTFSIASDPDAMFAIDGTSLELAQSPNYESHASHQVTLRATDTVNSLAYDEIFSITVTNVNETPTNMSLSVATVAENTSVGGTIGNLSTTDPDAGDTFVYSLLDDAGGLFSIVGAALKVASALDYETNTSHEITVRTTDFGTLTFDKDFTITVTDVDDTPSTITSSNAPSVAENAALSHSLTANESVTWSLVGGADLNKFELSGNTLRFASNGTKDYESPNDADANNSYVVVVRATDGANNTTDQTVTVTVTDVDDTAPTITSANASSTPENTTFDHTLTANESVTWSLVGGSDQARMEVSGNTLRWASNGTKDYEAPNDSDTNNTYVATVRATDTSNNTTDQTITVTVTNADDTAPTITSSSASSTPENTTFAHSLTADESVSWSIVGGADQARFDLSSNTLRWVSNGTKDYETPNDSDTNNTYVVTVRATDGASNTTDQTITVTVTDVEEGHRYWRIYATAAGNYFVASEIELRESNGGADATGSGTASADSVAFSGVASNAFDDNTSTYWHSSTGYPHWIQYDFGTGVLKVIKQVSIRARLDQGSTAPKDFQVQYSDNGTNWTTYFAVSDQLTWANGETRVFSYDDNLWRVYITSSEQGTYANIVELELRPSVGGADATGSGQSFESDDNFGSPATGAFDNNTSTFWHSAGVFPTFIGYRWLDTSFAGVQQISIRVRPSPDHTKAPKDFKIQTSSDRGQTWTDVWSVTGQTGWTSSETRLFTRP